MSRMGSKVCLTACEIIIASLLLLYFTQTENLPYLYTVRQCRFPVLVFLQHIERSTRKKNIINIKNRHKVLVPFLWITDWGLHTSSKSCERGFTTFRSILEGSNMQVSSGFFFIISEKYCY